VCSLTCIEPEPLAFRLCVGRAGFVVVAAGVRWLVGVLVVVIVFEDLFSGSVYE
jgi:hypothetical protein